MERIPTFDNYFLCLKHFEVFYYRCGEYHALKPIERVAGLAYQLSRNGARQYLSLLEVVELVFKKRVNLS